MPEPIASRETIEREAREAAKQYSNVNDACPYPFHTEAGQIFHAEFNAIRAARGAAPELKP